MTQHKKTPASLFPATLPVRLVDGQPRTSSLDIARHFGKNHQHVLRDIRDIVKRLDDPGRLSNFGQTSFLDSQGRSQPMYLLNRDAFVFVVGGFTGARADACKWQFIDAFNALEAELAAAQARYAAALDLIAPALRPVAEDARAGLPRAVTAARLGKSVGSITWHRSRARRLQLLAPVSERLPLSDGQRRKAVQTIEAQAAADAHAAYEAARALLEQALAQGQTVRQALYAAYRTEFTSGCNPRGFSARPAFCPDRLR